MSAIEKLQPAQQLAQEDPHGADASRFNIPDGFHEAAGRHLTSVPGDEDEPIVAVAHQIDPGFSITKQPVQYEADPVGEIPMIPQRNSRAVRVRHVRLDGSRTRTHTGPDEDGSFKLEGGPITKLNTAVGLGRLITSREVQKRSQGVLKNPKVRRHDSFSPPYRKPKGKPDMAVRSLSLVEDSKNRVSKTPW